MKRACSAVLLRPGRPDGAVFPELEDAVVAAHTAHFLVLGLSGVAFLLGQLGIEPRIRFGDGNPADWQSLAAGWDAAGASHLTVITMGSGFSTAEDHIAAIERFATALDLKPPA